MRNHWPEDIYVDVVDPLERTVESEQYVALLNTLSEALDTKGALGFLYAYDTDDPPYNRRYTLDLADFVIRLETRTGRSKLTFHLEIPKASGLSLRPDDRFLELEIGADVDVDETRTI